MEKEHQGEHVDAVVMSEKSLKIKLSALGDNHPNIAISKSSLITNPIKPSSING